MKIELPQLPPYDVGIRGQVMFAFSEDALQAYARQAIREFVEGQQVVAWASDYGLSTPIGMGSFTVQKEERAFHHCPLIIKPELDT